MRCQHCGKPEQRHQLHFVNGMHTRGRCLDGDGTSWLPSAFDPSIPPGGYVCAVETTGAEPICGLPVESEPCDVHGGAA